MKNVNNGKHDDDDDDQGLSWDELYDDNSDINDLNEKFSSINNLNGHGNKSESINNNDESSSASRYESTNENNSNILEIYDISPDLKTKDIVNCLSYNNFKNYEIDWVDDTHALVTFQSNLQAIEALKKMFPIMKVRPLREATKESKLKAKKLTESGITRKLRPETSSLTAQRLVMGALGLKLSKIDPDKRNAEREKLRLAKERKEKIKESKNIWNDEDL